MSFQLSCGGSLMKCILFIFNFFIWLCGCAMLAVGIWLLVDDNLNEYLTIINYDTDDTLVKAAAYTLLGVGALIFLVGFFGCCGACKESSWMLCLYSILCLICLLGELTVAILAIVYKDEVAVGLEESMKTQVVSDVEMNEYENPTVTTAAWHAMQVDFKCCGSSSYTDYQENEGYSTDTPVPQTCCVLTNDDPKNPQPENLDGCYTEANYENATHYLYSQGCYDALYNWMDERLWILIGIGFGVAFIQMLGIVFACCVRKEMQGDVDFS